MSKNHHKLRKNLKNHVNKSPKKLKIAKGVLNKICWVENKIYYIGIKNLKWVHFTSILIWITPKEKNGNLSFTLEADFLKCPILIIGSLIFFKG